MKRIAALFLVLASCGGETASGPTSGPTADLNAPLLSGDLERHWQKPDGLGQVFQDASGFYALGPYGFFTSSDGATWQQGWPVSATSAAFGGGRFVAVDDHGTVSTGISPFFGVDWSSITQTTFTNVAYANGLFFARDSLNEVQVSTDGTSWTKLDQRLIGFGSAAYGNGIYVLVGTCGTLISTDGTTWTSSSFSDCVVDAARGFFANGLFYADGFSSPDGKTWSPLRHHATSSAGGFLFDEELAANDQLSAGLDVWQGDGPSTEIPVDVVQSGVTSKSGLLYFGGATCNDHRCVILGTELFLIE